MDKEEFRIKLEDINRLVEQKDYKGAMNVVDSIDWRRVKNVRTLCVVGEIYAANKRYEDSKEIFLLAYHRAPIGKNILYRLIEISLKMGDVDEATEFYEEYREVAPNDNTCYVLRYKILKEQKAPIQEQIQVLEAYKEREFTEKWSYELAKLYYQAGENQKCLDLCNEMVLWFSEGSYVMRALDLKMRMGALTGAEKEKYEAQFVPKLLKPEEADSLKEEAAEAEVKKASEESDHPEIESISITNERELGSVESFQEKISKGIRDIFGSRKDSAEDGELTEKAERESEVHEEMIRDHSAEQELKNVPELEPEDRTEAAAEAVQTENETETQTQENTQEEPTMKENLAAAVAEAMKMPTLDIPDSMKKMETVEAEIPKVPVQSKLDYDEIEAAAQEPQEFNLEDTILAAASAQGIEIPETEKKEEASEPKEEISQPEAETEAEIEAEPETAEPKEKTPLVQLEEEDFLSEEDLREAEAEFLNGPSGKKSEEDEIPRLEDEIFENPYPDDDEVQENDFIADMLKNSVEEDDPTDRGIMEEDFEDEEVAELSEEEQLERFIDSIQPKEDPRDIIPRAKELSDDEKKLFTYFVKVPGMKDQLVEALYNAQMAASDKTSRDGNIMVMGGRGTGKTRLIASLIPAICQELNMEAAKVAYVFADQINGRDVSSMVSRLSGGFLVIEDANQLTQETVELLDKAMEFRTDGLVVILEDEKIGMRKLIARFPKFAKKFTSMINIPVFTNDELVNFARVYTKENGFKIDQMGMLALYNLIGLNQKEDMPMSISAVKTLLDGAMAKSQGGLLKFNKKKRVDKDGFMMLHEKDFMK